MSNAFLYGQIDNIIDAKKFSAPSFSSAEVNFPIDLFSNLDPGVYLIACRYTNNSGNKLFMYFGAEIKINTASQMYFSSCSNGVGRTNTGSIFTVSCSYNNSELTAKTGYYGFSSIESEGFAIKYY